MDTICFYLIYYLITTFRTESPVNFFGADQILFTMVACNALSVYLVGGFEYQKLESNARFVSEHILASVIGAIFSLFIILLFVSYAERVDTNRTSLIGTFILFSLYSIFCRSLIGHIRSNRKKENTLCKKCQGTGYKGRVGAYELLLLNRKIQNAISKGLTDREIENLAVSENSMLTLTQYGIELVKENLTTISEVIRVCKSD